MLASEVIDQVLRARSEVSLFGLTEPDELEMVDVVAQQQLMQRCGEATSLARLDPQVHARRTADALGEATDGRR